jgi:hypothetical protein
MTATIVLFGYAAAVAALAPRLLSRAWLLRSPRLALLLWHTSAVSVLLAVVLTGVTCLAMPGLVAACLEALTGRDTAAGALSVGLGLLLPVLLAGRLAVVIARLLRVQRADRARHVEVLDVLGRRDPDLDATVIPAAAPAAYCIPHPSRIVVTEAAIAALDRCELRAVLAHERAHLSGRHHVIVTWATVLANAFAGVPVFRDLKQATTTLVELLADDHAVRRESRDTMADAIAVLGLGRHATAGLPSSLAATGGPALVRLNRLLDPPPPLPAACRVGGVGAAVSLLALPALVIVLPVVAVACPLMFG